MACRIVLVEDHAMLREALELMLARGGCEVLGSAEDYESGLALVRESEPDVVVVDVGLRARSGIDLARELLGDGPRRRVVLYTGSSEFELLLDGLDSGAQGYALKEGGSEELLDAIHAVASGATYIDPRLRPALLSHSATERLPTLSTREREIMSLLAEGLTGDEVAERLVLSAETVKTHVRNAITKLEARNRVHAIALALRAGEITLAV